MTSLQFFDHSNIEPRPAVEWGTGDLQSEKFDPTLIKAPTFLLKNQPITQYYKESNIELSNVRTNDQLMPSPLKENFLDKKIMQKFPMNHPFTSQISYKALFPSFSAPEDATRGEKALNSMLDKQTPAQIENTIVLKKNSGKPWRHEVHYPTLPSQQQGLWYNDKEYYHYPKPNYNQQFYPAPPSLLTPNPRLRQAHSIDLRTANTLKNKENELMQSAQRIDYYKDGLGTRAVLNSDDLHEKKVRFSDDSKEKRDEMKPYFRRGAGISKSTLENDQMNITHQENYQIYEQNFEHKIPLTKVEKDQIVIENGANYKNLPETNYLNNPSFQLYQRSDLSFNRSKTMPDLKTNVYKPSKELLNKLDSEKRKIQTEYHDRIQNLEYENRRKEIELIKAENDIRCLRINHKELENSRGSHPNLKQNIQPHVNTLYQQEAKFLGERAELYKPQSYNPHLLKQCVETVKDDSKVSANFTNGSGYASQKDVHIKDETYEHRPKLFADKTFTDHKTLKREPLENVLKNPNQSADPVLQENGYIQQQTTYGQSYSTKKYLQENTLNQIGDSNIDLSYSKLDQAELDYQNITLKSKADQVAFYDYKNGLTNESNNMMRANAIVDKIHKDSKETEYPRYAGPMPPEPYEPLYCNTLASEMSDGYTKRNNLRVYDSPFVKASQNYEALKTDLEAMQKYEQNELNSLVTQEEHIKNAYQKAVDTTPKITHIDKSNELTARRFVDKVSTHPISTYNSSYTSYNYEEQKQCPPNEFYKNIQYTQNPSFESKQSNESVPQNLVQLQDLWSKTLAHKQYHSAHPAKNADLRENIHTGKKIIYEAPPNAYKFALI